MSTQIASNNDNPNNSLQILYIYKNVVELHVHIMIANRTDVKLPNGANNVFITANGNIKTSRRACRTVGCRL